MEMISREVLTFLLNALWQVPLIAGVAALACRLMRQGPASHRHVVWVAALLAAVLLPLASVSSGERASTGAFAAPEAPHLSMVSTTGSTANAGASSGRISRTIAYAPKTATILLAAYLLFVLYRVGRLSWAWRRTVQIRDSAGWTAEESRVRRVWARCLEAFGLRGVELLSSRHVASPVAAGVWNRSIILPESLFAGAAEDVLTTAIGHEMAHLARHDFPLNIVYELLSLPVAFHPAAWLIVRGIEETREMACDELVTRKLLDAEAYARSMVSIAATMTAVRQPGYTLGVFDGDILEQRVRRLLHRPAANLKRARLLLAAGLSAVAVCAVVASAVALTARAQSAGRTEIDAKNRAAQLRMEALYLKPGDPQLQSEARQAFLGVLSADPGNEPALNAMMTISVMAKQPVEARQWALKMASLYPNEKTAQYCLGFADWSVVYPAVMAAHPDHNFVTDDAVRQNLRGQYGAIVDEGLQALAKAIAMDAHYSDAMAYTNLLYRMKAAIAETPAESTKAVAVADEWVGKAIEAKQHAGTPQPGTWIVAPPPPPPPPPPPQIPDNAMASDASMPAQHHDGRGTFWQVLGPSDMPAKTLVAQLKSAGFQAGTALSGSDRLVRVVVGPYKDQDALTETRTHLEAAGYRVIRPW